MKYITVILFFIHVVTYGQDFKQAVLDMQQLLKDAKQMRIVMDVNVYESEKKRSLLYHDKIEVNKDMDNYLYHYGNNDFLMNKDYVMMVDKNEKEIMLRKRDVKSERELQRKISFNIDSLLSLYDEAPQYVATENNSDHFLVHQRGSEVTKIDLYISRYTHLIQRMDYSYRTGQYVTIQFNEFDLQPKFPENKFGESNYVQHVKGEIYPTGVYKTFRLVN